MFFLFFFPAFKLLVEHVALKYLKVFNISPITVCSTKLLLILHKEQGFQLVESTHQTFSLFKLLLYSIQMQNFNASKPIMNYTFFPVCLYSLHFYKDWIVEDVFVVSQKTLRIPVRDPNICWISKNFN
jgi:hypothetical protein